MMLGESIKCKPTKTFQQLRHGRERREHNKQLDPERDVPYPTPTPTLFMILFHKCLEFGIMRAGRSTEDRESCVVYFYK